MASEPTVEEARPGEASGRGIVTLALLLAMAVTALEQTVVSPAMPAIIASLRGMDIYPWVFSAYLLAATISTPLYGKLADLFGRRRVLLFGLALFGAGSILSGLAQSMVQLIAMRTAQGLGAGAVAPIVLTMLGDLYPLHERAKVQGWFSGVWGVCSLAGPAIGGVLTDYLSWRWVFFVTIPFAAVAGWVLVVHVREAVRPRAVRSIDWPGAALLAGGSGVLLTAALGGQGRSLGVVGALLGLAIVLILAFIAWERRAADPVLPLDLLAQPSIAAAVAGSFLIGGLLFGIDTYVPLYVQGVLGGSASRAGQAITPLFLAWAISVAVAAKVVVRLGFRATALIGSALIATGSVALSLGVRNPDWAGRIFLVGLAVIGLGMGPTSLSYILGVQGAVAWGRRGVATGAVTFFRTLGGALCVGLLGALLGYGLAHRLDASGVAGIDVADLLRPHVPGVERSLTLPAALADLVRGALGRSLRNVFDQMAGLAAVNLICAALLPGGRAASAPEASDRTAEDEVMAAGLAEA